MDDQNDKIFTADDIIRYHSGTMPEMEMHPLEKAALEDPFLADALEGYLNTTTANEDLEDIRERLSEKKKSKVIPIKKSNDMWFRIAALLILIVGAGYMIYYFNSKKEDRILAKTEDSSKVDKRPFFKQGDTTKAAINNNVYLTESDAGRSNKPHLKNTESKKTITTVGSTYATSDYVKQNDLTSGNVVTKADNVYLAPSIQEKELTGKIVDSSGNPVAYANIKDSKNRTTATDSAGKFTFKSTDATMTVNIAATGYNERKAKLKNGKTIVLQPKQKYKEIVAVNEDKRKKEKEENDSVIVFRGSEDKKAEDNLPRVIGIDSFFQPVKGWMDYNEYMSDNSNLFDKCKGQMVLSFITDKKGYPIKVNVEKSLSYECDEKAIKLLRDGPKWNSIPNKRCNITLQF